MSDFWSRRRASVEAEEAAQARAEEEARGAAVAEGAETDAEICEALGLPDPDALGPGDDVSAFMRRVVPQHLRRRALRALWARDPRLANLDGLVDYGQDFTDAGVKAGVVTTVYEVGRGIARRVEAAAEDGDAQDGDTQNGDAQTPGPASRDVAGPDAGNDTDDSAAAAGVASSGRPAPEGVAPNGEAEPAARDVAPPTARDVHGASDAAGLGIDPPPSASEAAEPPTPPRRRMRFAFAQDAA